MRVRLVVNPERCTGCNSCVLACSFAHTKEYAFETARVRTARDAEHAEARPLVCIQCAEAPCLAACPTGALARSAETGAIAVDSDLCTGCGVCRTACPYDGIHWDAASKRPLICDLCGGEPECALVCQFPKAITIQVVEQEDPA